MDSSSSNCIPKTILLKKMHAWVTHFFDSLFYQILFSCQVEYIEWGIYYFALLNAYCEMKVKWFFLWVVDWSFCWVDVKIYGVFCMFRYVKIFKYTHIDYAFGHYVKECVKEKFIMCDVWGRWGYHEQYMKENMAFTIIITTWRTYQGEHILDIFLLFLFFGCGTTTIT
jgi:hypothetical protein